MTNLPNGGTSNANPTNPHNPTPSAAKPTLRLTCYIRQQNPGHDYMELIDPNESSMPVAIQSRMRDIHNYYSTDISSLPGRCYLFFPQTVHDTAGSKTVYNCACCLKRDEQSGKRPALTLIGVCIDQDKLTEKLPLTLMRVAVRMNWDEIETNAKDKLILEWETVEGEPYNGELARAVKPMIDTLASQVGNSPAKPIVTFVAYPQDQPQRTQTFKALDQAARDENQRTLLNRLSVGVHFGDKMISPPSVPLDLIVLLRTIVAPAAVPKQIPAQSKFLLLDKIIVATNIVTAANIVGATSIVAKNDTARRWNDRIWNQAWDVRKIAKRCETIVAFDSGSRRAARQALSLEVACLKEAVGLLKETLTDAERRDIAADLTNWERDFNDYLRGLSRSSPRPAPSPTDQHSYSNNSDTMPPDKPENIGFDWKQLMAPQNPLHPVVLVLVALVVCALLWKFVFSPVSHPRRDFGDTTNSAQNVTVFPTPTHKSSGKGASQRGARKGKERNITPKNNETTEDANSGQGDTPGRNSTDAPPPASPDENSGGENQH